MAKLVLGDRHGRRPLILLAGTSALAADLYPPLERARVQGLLGAMFGVSSILGPIAGGALSDALSWHWVFFINAPLGAVSLWVLARRLPAQASSARYPVDYAGAALLTVATVALLLALSLGTATPQPEVLGFAWPSWPILSLFIVAFGSLSAFVMAERRAADPLLPLGLFRERTFALSVAAVFVLGAGLLTAGVFLPLFLINVVGVSATAAGPSTTPLMVAVIIGSVVSGIVTTRVKRYKPVMLAGLAVLFLGFGLLGFTLTAQTSAWVLSLKMVVVGLGFGPVVSLYVLAVQNALPTTQIGVATSSVTFFQQLGGSVGLAVLGGIFASGLGAEGLAAPGSAAFRETYEGAISTLSRAGLVIVVLGGLWTALLPNQVLRSTPADEAESL